MGYEPIVQMGIAASTAYPTIGEPARQEAGRCSRFRSFLPKGRPLAATTLRPLAQRLCKEMIVWTTTIARRNEVVNIERLCYTGRHGRSRDSVYLSRRIPAPKDATPAYPAPPTGNAVAEAPAHSGSSTAANPRLRSLGILAERAAPYILLDGKRPPLQRPMPFGDRRAEST